MKTKFPKDSNTGRLWSDMLTEAERAGRSAADLEAEVDREHLGGNMFEWRRVSSVDGSLGRVEVLEYAYAHKECYPLLVKHGFPVNFAMNDFNESTKTDKKWRDRLVTSLDAIKAEVSDSFKSKIGSDKYKKALTGRVVTELRGLVNLQQKYCPVEVPDWQALEDRCGACTEFSTILYFALEHVGLDPTFMFARDSLPKMSALTQMSQYAGEGDSHVLVGVSLAGGAMIYADLMSPEIFCDKDKYPFIVGEMSARKFAAVQEAQRLDEKYLGNTPPGAMDALVEMDPDDPEVEYLRIRRRMDRMSPEELNFATDQLRLSYPDSEFADYLAAVLEHDYALHNNTIKRSHTNAVNVALERLIDANPYAGSVQLYFKAQKYLTEGIEKTKKALAGESDLSKRADLEIQMEEYKTDCLGFLSRSVLLNPLWFRSIQLLDKLSIEWLQPAARVELYRSLVQAHPEHSHFRFLLAQSCTQCAFQAHIEKESGAGCGDPVELVEEAMSNYSEIAHRLEPNLADAHLLLASGALLVGEQKKALREIDEGIEILGAHADGLMPAQIALLIKAIYTDDGRLAGDALDKIEELEPENFPQRLYQMNETSGDLFLGPDGKPLSDNSMIKRGETLGMLIQRIAARRPELADSLWAGATGNAVLHCYGRRRVADAFRANIREPESENVQNTFVNVLRYNAIPAFKKSKFKFSKFRDALKIVKYMEEILVPGKIAAATDTYLIIADKAVRAGKLRETEAAVVGALRTGGDAAGEAFFEQTVKVIFSECLSNDVPAAKLRKAFMQVWTALGAMWSERDNLSGHLLLLLRDAYVNAQDVCGRLKNRAKAKAAAERADELTRMIEG